MGAAPRVQVHVLPLCSETSRVILSQCPLSVPQPCPCSSESSFGSTSAPGSLWQSPPCQGAGGDGVRIPSPCQGAGERGHEELLSLPGCRMGRGQRSCRFGTVAVALEGRREGLGSEAHSALLESCGVTDRTGMSQYPAEMLS